VRRGENAFQEEPLFLSIGNLVQPRILQRNAGSGPQADRHVYPVVAAREVRQELYRRLGAQFPDPPERTSSHFLRGEIFLFQPAFRQSQQFLQFRGNPGRTAQRNAHQ